MFECNIYVALQILKFRKSALEEEIWNLVNNKKTCYLFVLVSYYHLTWSVFFSVTVSYVNYAVSLFNNFFVFVFCSSLFSAFRPHRHQDPRFL